MATKTQKRKEQKKANRKKRLAKERNIRVNGVRFRFMLECRMSTDKPWKAMKRFRDVKEVNRHLEETEAVRKRGDTDIIEGRVIDHNQLDRVVATVKPFSFEAGPSMKQASKDIRKAIEGIKDYTGPQGGRAIALGINKENFTKPVGKSNLPTVSKCEEKHELNPEAANAETSELKPD
jgi:hypothetical protein